VKKLLVLLVLVAIGVAVARMVGEHSRGPGEQTGAR
jgi:hypothetical protein